MLFSQRFHEPIRTGRVTLAFRRWRRPTVKTGGRLRTAFGVISIESVRTIDVTEITRSEVRRAGYDELDELLGDLHASEPGRKLYRIQFRYKGADPRAALRTKEDLRKADVEEIALRLRRLDGAAKDGAWTQQLLRLIQTQPATAAGELAETLGDDRTRLKRRVRRLKELGLTESLGTGYRLSPRGEAYLRATK